MNSRRGPKKKEILDADRKRWNELGDKAEAEFDRFVDRQVCGLPSIEALAWLHGSKGLEERINQLVKSARRENATWAEIAVALGESGDSNSANRIQSRFHKRSRKNFE